MALARRCPDIVVFDRPWLGPRRKLHLRRRTIHGRTVTLQCKAMASLLAAADELRSKGIPLVVTQSFRTHKQQRAIYNSGVRPAAPPGSSFHEQGLAVDLYFKGAWRDDIHRAMSSRGWNQFDPVNDGGHWSYKVTG